MIVYYNNYVENNLGLVLHIISTPDTFTSLVFKRFHRIQASEVILQLKTIHYFMLFHVLFRPPLTIIKQ